MGKPIQKAYFILSKGGEKAVEFLEEALSSLAETERIYVDDEEDVYSIMLKILEVIVEEKRKRGSEVYVNVSDAGRDSCIACLFSAQISKTKVYMALNGKVIIVILLTLALFQSHHQTSQSSFSYSCAFSPS